MTNRIIRTTGSVSTDHNTHFVVWKKIHVNVTRSIVLLDINNFFLYGVFNADWHIPPHTDLHAGVPNIGYGDTAYIRHPSSPPGHIPTAPAVDRGGINIATRMINYSYLRRCHLSRLRLRLRLCTAHCAAREQNSNAHWD